LVRVVVHRALIIIRYSSVIGSNVLIIIIIIIIIISVLGTFAHTTPEVEM